MRKVIVVGNGLFGSMAATLCRHNGMEVVVVSDKRPHMASLASGGIIAPSSLSSMSIEQIAKGREVLDTLYKVRDVEFKTNLGKKFKTICVPPDRVLLHPDVQDTVVEVKPGRIKTKKGLELEGAVLVAAGAWSQELISSMPEIVGQWGASIRVPTPPLESREPQLKVYAPYRQAVAFTIAPRLTWVGDGTALSDSTWKAQQEDRVRTLQNRATEWFGLSAANVSRAKVNVGVRPYVKDHKAGYFEKVSKNLWVSTGGAKNGTMLAAYFAHLFLEAL